MTFTYNTDSYNADGYFLASEELLSCNIAASTLLFSNLIANDPVYLSCDIESSVELNSKLLTQSLVRKTMNTDQNISILLSSQLPEYIRNNPDYSNFVLFIQAYYEWMEQENNSLYQTNNLLNYSDIYQTTSKFLEYYVNDFLQYFPSDALISKPLALRIAKELYKAKGTFASYQFLFRVLYNSDFEVFYTKDAVLRASDGIWYVPKSLKLSTSDLNFLNIKNYSIFGESSKSIATIENSKISGDKIEVFISDDKRAFQSGEYVRIVDNNYRDVLVNNTILRAKIVGQIGKIDINPNYRGTLYYSGDPVIVYGGLDQSVNPVKATAAVDSTTQGSIQHVNVNNGGFGYTKSPNTILTLANAGSANISVSDVTSILPPTILINNAGSGYNINDIVVKGNTTIYTTFADVTGVNSAGAITEITYRSGINANLIFGITANVISSNTLASNANIQIANTFGNGQANVSYIVADTITSKVPYHLGNTSNIVAYNFTRMPSANINTKLSDALSFNNFSTYSIASVLINNGGTGISQQPTISAESTYITDSGIDDLATLGILSPIQIINPGTGYQINDTIIFSGGVGYGASANVTSVDSRGGITTISYVYPTSSVQYPLGGMGYTQSSLPTLSVHSANTSASGASVIVPSILGTGATFSMTLSKVGAINTIKVLNYGEDYISAPNVSLQVQDIVVTCSSSILPASGDIIYQGTSLTNATYIATLDSIKKLTFDANPLYSLRVYNYNSQPNGSLLLLSKSTATTFTMMNRAYSANTFYVGSPEYNTSGVKSYGDGTAQATASFLNGLTIGQGQYLNSQGQLSEFSVLQNENYNNFTYQITVEKEISKYRDILLNLLHTSGMHVLGRYAIKSNSNINITSTENFANGVHLSHYGYNTSNVTMSGSFTQKSTNIAKFNIGANSISSIISANNILILNPTVGATIKSKVISVDGINNLVTLSDNVWVTYANVAYVSGSANSNTLYVNTITNSYDIVNNGKYSTTNKLNDIAIIGDKIKLGSNVYSISNVDYVNNIIQLNSTVSTNTNNSIITINRSIISGGSTLTANQITIFGK